MEYKEIKEINLIGITIEFAREKWRKKHETKLVD